MLLTTYALGGLVFTPTQAMAAGYSDDEVRRAVRGREWFQLRHGVYVDARIFQAASPLGQHRLFTQGNLLKLGKGTVGSHGTAAYLLGLDMLKEPTTSVTLTRPVTTVRLRQGLHVLAAPLADHEIVRDEEGVLVTSAARTVLDCARELPFRDALVIADSALRRDLAAPAELDAALERARHWRGAQNAGRVVSFSDGRAESPGESLMRIDVHALGYFDAEPQLPLVGPSGDLYYGDLALIPERVLIEFDGQQKYVDSKGKVKPGVREAERAREQELQQLGWVIVRIIWSDLGRLDVIERKLHAAVMISRKAGWASAESRLPRRRPSFAIPRCG